MTILIQLGSDWSKKNKAVRILETYVRFLMKLRAYNYSVVIALKQCDTTCIFINEMKYLVYVFLQLSPRQLYSRRREEEKAWLHQHFEIAENVFPDDISILKNYGSIIVYAYSRTQSLNYQSFPA